jgi:hypothetical protein
VRRHLQELEQGLRAWRAEHDYYNFAESPVGAEALFPRATYRRLQALKTTYDPDEAIVSAHRVRPAVP